MAEATMIVVAQRVASIEHADQILGDGGRLGSSPGAPTPSWWRASPPTARSSSPRSPRRSHHEHPRRPSQRGGDPRTRGQGR
ncbi:hypothetical protein QP028_08895 [Corynebacterium suedekumii]|nr:hypothetical protein QP028_08895 [Corynebacterium suedekumii]